MAPNWVLLVLLQVLEPSTKCSAEESSTQHVSELVPGAKHPNACQRQKPKGCGGGAAVSACPRPYTLLGRTFSGGPGYKTKPTQHNPLNTCAYSWSRTPLLGNLHYAVVQEESRIHVSLLARSESNTLLT